MSEPDNSAAARPGAPGPGAPAGAAPGPTPPPRPASPVPSGARRRVLGWIIALFVVAGAGWAAYHWYFLSHVESTDNAYVQATIVQITPQVSGTVTQVFADDTDHVKPGQTLVRFDPADAQVALEQAKAQLGQTVREVRTLFANNQTLASQVEVRNAELERLRAELKRVTQDIERREPLLASGAVALEEVEHARSQVQTLRSQLAAAQSALAAARAQLASNQVLTDGTSVERHPSVARAASRVHEAQLALQRGELVAPIEGYVARRNVQIGQRVAAGTAVMSLVALDKVWVDANFKEVQLKHLRLGQSVRLFADVYGQQVEYRGKIDGIGSGTGSAFSLLPAQNASGNWIKVVQRLPVRIALDPAQVAKHPLRVGLSMRATVDVRSQDGPVLAPVLKPPTVVNAGGEESARQAADEIVRRVIAENLGRR